MQTNWIPPSTLAALDVGFVVTVMLETAKGEGDELAELLRVLTPATTAEPGVKLFLPYRSRENPDQFFIFELYADEAAWAAHQQTPHFKAATKDMLSRLVRRERVPFVPF